MSLKNPIIRKAEKPRNAANPLARRIGGPLALVLLLLLLPAGGAAAQGFRIDRSTGLESEAPAAPKAPAASGGAREEDARQPTEITASKETTFDEKSRTAVFLGDVTVHDAQFHLTCEKLTAYLKKNRPAAEGAEAAGLEAAGDAGGLERVVAEGGVTIVQEKTDEKGKATRYVGKARKAEYDAATGNLRLSGWPQISQGINTQVATEEDTVMILNRAGSIKAQGPSKTVISDTSSEPVPGRQKPGASRSGGGAKTQANP